MKRIVSSVFMSFALLGAGVAAAQPSTQPSAPAAGAITAEVKAGTGVENKEVAGEAAEFTAGTKVFVWSRVFNAAGTRVTHRWKLNGQDNWKVSLNIGSKRWSTSSRRKVKAGSWTVEVVAADGSVIGSVDFTVK